MIKKVLMMAFAVLSMSTTAMADDAIVVTFIGTDGDSVEVAELAEIEKIGFQGDSAYITFTDAAVDTLYFHPEEADKIYFSAGSITGIQSVKAGDNANLDKVTIAANGALLNVSGVKAGTIVAVYDINGRMAAQVKATADTVSLDATSLKSGMYIVRAGNKATKLIKK